MTRTLKIIVLVVAVLFLAAMAGGLIAAVLGTLVDRGNQQDAMAAAPRFSKPAPSP